jgi:hypothetical protein
VIKKVGYQWHLRRLMAERELCSRESEIPRSANRGPRSVVWCPGVWMLHCHNTLPLRSRHDDQPQLRHLTMVRCGTTRTAV